MRGTEEWEVREEGGNGRSEGGTDYYADLRDAMERMPGDGGESSHSEVSDDKRDTFVSCGANAGSDADGLVGEPPRTARRQGLLDHEDAIRDGAPIMRFPKRKP